MHTQRESNETFHSFNAVQDYVSGVYHAQLAEPIRDAPDKRQTAEISASSPIVLSGPPWTRYVRGRQRGKLFLVDVLVHTHSVTHCRGVNLEVQLRCLEEQFRCRDTGGLTPRCT
jgi:hypothetical protein